MVVAFAYAGFHNRGGFATVEDGGNGRKHLPGLEEQRYVESKSERVRLSQVEYDEIMKLKRDSSDAESDGTLGKRSVSVGQPQRNVEDNVNRNESGVLPGFENSDHSSRVNRLATLSVNETTVAANATATDNSQLHCPQGFVISDPDVTWFRTSVAQKSEKYDVVGDKVDDVIILTPISNVKRHLQKYFQNICSLSYPHRRISIVLGEDSSTDDTLEEAEGLASEVRPYFKRVEVIKLKGSSSGTSGHVRHEMSFQLTRRRHLAMARNQLLFTALERDEKWVLWMDSDVRHIPADLVERLLWPQKSIVVANCLYRRDDGRGTDTFDRNTWRDTEASKNHLVSKPEDFLMLEGYNPSQRKFLNDLKEEGDVVKIDGVGGCVLLVEADAHRKGLIFPSFVFDHHVETEGLAKMAARMGIEMYGLPSVNVIHW